MRQRVWEAAHVELKEVTLDTDTTVQTVYGRQMGARKGYNPQHRGKKSYQRMSSEGWCIQWESTPPLCAAEGYAHRTEIRPREAVHYRISFA
jgi:hypothetical protein